MGASAVSLHQKGGSVAGLIPPVTRDPLRQLVVPRESVDARLDENQTELGVSVLTVAVHVLTHLDGLLNQAVEILRELGGDTARLQDAEDLGAWI